MSRLLRILGKAGAAFVGLAAVGSAAGWAIAPGLPDEVFAQDHSTVVLDREGEVLRAYLSSDEQWRLPLSGEGLPDKLTQAVLAFEDTRFFVHPGIDPVAVVRAAVGNVIGWPASGASTLTMQVARLAQPKERTFASKLIELKHALVLEWRYSKEEILRLWLAQTPYGGNLVGVETAARRYFGCSPWELSWGQAAFLAILPKSPNLAATAEGRERLQQRRDRLLERLHREGVVDEETARLARAEAIPRFDYALPFTAPHAADWVRRTHPDQPVLATTLDRDLQERAARVVQTHAGLLRRRSVENVAALIVHNPTGEVRAYLGSQHFLDDEGQGQVDGIQAARSSGSILKPFLYALAMERGLLVPQTLLPDVPTHFGSFTPQNHDHRFAGEVTMAEALIESKNVPAVRVLAQLGVHDFHGLLEAAGFSTLFRSPDEYGLALVLGGAEVRLWDLAAAYRGLARQGRFGPLTLLQDPPDDEERALLSAGAAEATLEVMRDLKRPGAELYWQLFGNAREIAWKTGTSFGHRDAWAVGVDDEWTVAVWAGNFSGEGVKDLWGSTGAAPVLFDLFALLPAPEGATRRPPGALPPGHQLVELCDDTGLKATEDCPHKTATAVPAHDVPLASCTSHMRFHVEGAEAVCSLCWEGHSHVEVRLVKPPEVNAWLRRHGQSPQEPPPHRRTCPSAAAAKELVVLQPTRDATLLIPRVGDGSHGAVVMRAAHQREEATVYWYLDGRFLGETAARHELSLVLPPGPHELRLVDDSGAVASRPFRAEWRDEGRLARP